MVLQHRRKLAAALRCVADANCLRCAGAVRDLTDRNRLWLFFSARWMQIVCLPGQHLHELLADKGCRLPLCFALEPSGIR